MSIRTIIVGIIAALCGISAAAGVMTMLQNSNKNKASGESPSVGLVVAKVNLELGQLIEENLVSQIDWHSDTLPPGSFSNVADVKGKYAIVPIIAGEVVSATRINDAPTMLQPGNGLRAIAIDAKAVSTNLGRNVVPGNRVDIIWQTSGKVNQDIDPVAIRLLQNVKILAVGQFNGEVDNSQRSITLEVKPTMDQDLTYAQSIGTLSLSLRNASDNEGVEPIELVNLSTLIASRAEEREKNLERAKHPTVSEELLKDLQQQIAHMQQRLDRPPEASKPAVDRDGFNRIGKGMRAITIQTPTESTALAGLLEPGDRVDMHLTVVSLTNRTPTANTSLAEKFIIPSETLIENIEVLAVDTKLYTLDKDGEKEMSRSVTLIVEEGMQQDVARAGQMGTLSLTLRGESDRVDGPPRTVMTLDQFVARNAPSAKGLPTNGEIPQIRTYRGTAAQEIPFSAKRPGKVISSL